MTVNHRRSRWQAYQCDPARAELGIGVVAFLLFPVIGVAGNRFFPSAPRATAAPDWARIRSVRGAGVPLEPRQLDYGLSISGMGCAAMQNLSAYTSSAKQLRC